MAFTLQSYIADPTLVMNGEFSEFIADPTLVMNGEFAEFVADGSLLVIGPRFPAFVADPTLSAVVTPLPAFVADPTLVTGNLKLSSFTSDPGTAIGTFAVATATASAFVQSYPVLTSTVGTTTPSAVQWNLQGVTTSSATVTTPALPGLSITISVVATAATTTTAASPTVFWGVATSAGVISGAITAERVVAGAVTGGIVFTSISAGQASYQVSAASLAQIISGIQFVQDYWDGWAFNLNTGAASTYEDFKFNSFARIGTNYYGCNETGVYLLSGDTDAGAEIAATVTLATTDMSTETNSGKMVKNIPTVYITAMSPEKLTLTARVEGAENTYETHTAKDTLASMRVDLGKGARGTLWQLEVANQSGADMELESMQIDVVATTRRR